MLHRVRKIGGVGPSLGPGCAVLGPTAAQAGANGSCSVEVGRKAIQMDPKLKPWDAYGSLGHIQDGAAGKTLVTASRQGGPNRDTT